jgi:hypothetical protein
MEATVYVLLVLPVVAAFIVLWYLDPVLIKRFESPFLTDVVEVTTALLILGAGEGVVLYFLL